MKSRFRLHFREPLTDAEAYQEALEGFGLKVLQTLQEGDETADVEGEAKIILGLRDQLKNTFYKIETLKR